MKIIIIISVLLLQALITNGQKKDCCCDDDTTILCNDANRIQHMPYTVLYDFKTGNIAFPKNSYKIVRGDAIKIKIVNFNRFLYQVSLNGKDTVHNAMINDSNIFGSFSTIANLPALVSNLAAVTAAGALNSSNTFKAMLSESYKSSAFVSPASTTKKIVKKDAAPDPDLQRKNSIKRFFSQHTILIRNYDFTTHFLKDQVDSMTTYGWSTLIKVLREPYPSCNDFTSIADGSIKNNLQKSFSDIKNSVRLLLDNLKLSRYSYLDSAATYADLIRASDAVNNSVADSLIRSYYDETIGYLTKVDSIMSYKTLQTLTEPFDKMKDIKPCFTSEPLFIMGDSKLINLTLIPFNDNQNILPTQNISFELPWTQRHIWGVTGGIYVSTLHNDNYTSRFDSTSATNKGYSLINDNTGKFEYGLNVLAYSDWKLNSNDKDYTYAGIAFGAGSSIESKPKPRFFLGLNLESGMNNRIVITAGLNGGFVDKLSSAYIQNQPYIAAPTGYIKDVFNVGAFLSISYSFLNK